MPSEAEDLDHEQQPPSEPTPVGLKPEHFYFEGSYMVFTAAYHLERGYCCNSNCRHCPYR